MFGYSKSLRLPPSSLRAATASVFEPLELRRMMSVTAWGSFIRVSGTAGHDHLRAERSADGSSLVIRENGVATFTCPLASAGRLQMNGFAGNDRIEVDQNVTIPATLSGGPDRDTLVGGGAADDLFGGDGWDDVNYQHRAVGLKLSIDNQWNDGATGDNLDNIRTDVEAVWGGASNDWLSGSDADNMLFGVGGNDTIDGLGGNDRLFGWTGNDWMFGGNGRDSIKGEAGADMMSGGHDWDDVDYGGHTVGVTVTIGDGRWNDGSAGEGDFVSSDVEAVWGGRGSDRLIGNSGDNMLFGMEGNDTLQGRGGNDSLFGWLGSDKLYGDAGNDNLHGEGGNDTVVSIGGGQSDQLWGGSESDSFWTDAEASERIHDADSTESSGGNVHRVGSYEPYLFGSSTVVNVSRDANREELADPSDGANYRDFSGRALFHRVGPRSSDIRQGSVGDCWLLSSLSSIAGRNPNRIRQSVTELGDGSYAVRFIWSGREWYYRVDGDLPTDGAGNLVNAGRGQGNSVWVAVVEKASAFFFNRGDYASRGTYGTLNGDWSKRALQAFGGTAITDRGTDSSGEALLHYIHGEVSAGKAVTFGTKTSGVHNSLVGAHAYSVVRVNWGWVSGVWKPVSVTLRNPWAFDGATVTDANGNDGLVTVGGNDALGSLWTVQAARV